MQAQERDLQLQGVQAAPPGPPAAGLLGGHRQQGLQGQQGQTRGQGLEEGAWQVGAALLEEVARQQAGCLEGVLADGWLVCTRAGEA